MQIRHAFIIGLFLLVSGILVGCATPPKSAPSGFLGNGLHFQPGPSDGVDQVYIKPDIDLSKYHRIMLDEVQFFLNKDTAEHGIQASELKELSDSFHRAVFEALGTEYPLVTVPGEDVLRVRLALTDIEISNPALSGVATVLPVGLAIDVVRAGATGKHSGVGGASMEVEFLDSMTGERLIAGIDTFNGSKMSGFSKLGATKEAFEFWAKRLRITLDMAHGKEPNK
ncbi:MAG: DUF3313 domain-containing protein [Desulfobulbus sp.]